MIKKEDLQTTNGLIAIGSPSYLNIQNCVPDPNPRPVSPKLIFDDIKSHKEYSKIMTDKV